jgi:hypothetical protein
MNDQANTIRDREALLRVYELFRDAAGPSDGEYDIELAWLEEMTKDFETAEQYGESDEQQERARDAKAAALNLKQAMSALADSRASGPSIQIIDGRTGPTAAEH